ncbi:MAG: 50S ribosomal protein L4 [Oscillospiraceae bacterium]|nr:50S ribosomal protein L4 [Oscillospiraceae bacterium]
MPKAKIYDMSGKAVGDVELSETVFGATPNKAALHTVITAHLNNKRQGTQSNLTRAEVRGGGRKPWAQKGTGRARHGSTRNPQWTGGGNAFAPKPRSYATAVNKKLRRVALRSALSLRAANEQIIVIRDLDLAEIKTKSIVNLLSAINVSGKALLVTSEPRVNVYKSARNIEGVNTTFSNVLNVYDVMNGTTLVLDEQALKNIEEGLV